jgi:hypothetical protein
MHMKEVNSCLAASWVSTHRFLYAEELVDSCMTKTEVSSWKIEIFLTEFMLHSTWCAHCYLQSFCLTCAGVLKIKIKMMSNLLHAFQCVIHKCCLLLQPISSWKMSLWNTKQNIHNKLKSRRNKQTNFFRKTKIFLQHISTCTQITCWM